MAVKTHVFNGRRYEIDMPGRIDGCVDQYQLNKRVMLITTEPHTKEELEACVHESLHAENWAATEKVIERTGREIADFLWRLGYRRTKK
ncbi:hypothetical protein LCGC14_1633730 [marine sediment metagenome]|uniref:Uncharacterized protein n=1 Tax=marine sediment metagenome TaxID=412755 RepID=A0A0F9KHH1_9ZZZZ